MNDLAAWLLEQIAEDERAARAAAEAPETEWRGAFDGLVGCYDLSVYEHTHIKRWLPDRVLTECDAKRRIVELAFESAARVDGEWGCCHDAETLRLGYRAAELSGDTDDALPDDCPGRAAVLPFLLSLAAPYADRAGYLDEWRPGVVAS